MNSRIFRFALALLISGGAIGSPAVSADTLVAQDDFESGSWNAGGGWSAAWKHSGRSRIRNDSEVHSGQKHVVLRGGNNGRIIRQLDLSSQENIQLRFWYRGVSFEKSGQALVKVYDGQWHEVLRLRAGDDDGIYHLADISLTRYQMRKDFRISFEIQANGSRDYLYLDDIQIITKDGESGLPQNISFLCDWEQALLAKGCWGELHAGANDRYTRVTSPVREGKYAVRVEVRPGDDPFDCAGCGERAEVSYMLDEQGRDIFENERSGVKFYAFSVMLDENWVTPEVSDDGLWGVIFQLHGPDELEASQSIALDVTGSEPGVHEGFNIILHGGDLDNQDNSLQWESYALSQADLNKGHWVDFIIKIRFAADFSGAVDVWRRDEGANVFAHVLALRDVPTLQYRSSINGGAVGEHYWQHGLYRPKQQHLVNVLWLDRFAGGSRFADMLKVMGAGIDAVSK
jgi:hypothetical protein